MVTNFAFSGMDNTTLSDPNSGAERATLPQQR